MKTKRTLLIGLVSMLLSTSPLYAQPDGEEAPAVPVEVSDAIEDELSATIWVPGTVVSRSDARIAAEISGRTTWVAEIGAYLDAGAPIAIVDDIELQLQLEDNRAAAKRLESQLSFLESQVARFNQLAKSNNAAATQLDEANSQLTMAQQDLAQVRIAGRRIQHRIDQTRITAPFSGQIVERLIQAGEYVNAGTAVARLVDTRNKEISARAPLSAAGYLAAGMNVAIRSDGGSATNSIRSVIPVGDDRSRMFEVRVAADQANWVIGAAVQVALPVSAARQLVAVPRDALVMRGNAIYVYRVNEAGVAERVDVTTGVGIGDLVEVSGQILAGDQLVVRGGERLQPGQAVAVLSRGGR